MHSLPDPYGECDANSAITVSECRLACLTRTVVQTCGCHDVYMNSTGKNAHYRLGTVNSNMVNSKLPLNSKFNFSVVVYFNCFNCLFYVVFRIST